MGAVKVKEINIERGKPTVEAAMRDLVNQLSTAKATGYKAAILVHGYGSSGTGGAIKIAAKGKLKERSMSGLVRHTAGGEDWAAHKKAFVDACPQLKDFQPTIDGNRGVTVILFR